MCDHHFKTLILMLLSLLLIACGQSDSEERIAEQMLFKFGHYYDTAAGDIENDQHIIEKKRKLLITLSQENSDALRSLAFLWQQRANQICGDATSSQTIATQTGYDSLLSDSQQTQLSISADDPKTVLCLQAFYRKNFSAMTNMLLFHLKNSTL
ncbi:MAG: hypothetical protein P8O97_03510 [Gammaproteobacteria bacterium]|nr:hypothetical protein [Gammaproteobacteria bacterium]